MKISYIAHAKDRMKERGISKKQVEETIVRGHSYTQKNDRVKSIYKDGGKNLIVIYWQIKENYKVITTFYS